MSTFSIDTISAFMAVGKRYSVDIKLHGMGMSTVLLQIDELSFEDFMASFDQARPDIIRAVNAFYGTCLFSEISVGDVPIDEAVAEWDRKNSHRNSLIETVYSPMLSHDRKALEVLQFALDSRGDDSLFETYQAIAWFVNLVNREIVGLVK